MKGMRIADVLFGCYDHCAVIRILVAFVLLSFNFDLDAQKTESDKVVDSTELSTDQNIWTRKTLTGNWGGARTDLKEFGISLKGSITNFYQGMTSGEGNSNFEFGSKLMGTVFVNAEKLGLWKGFFTVLRFDYNMGHSVNQRGGVLLPVNTALMYPGIEGADRFDMSFYLIQFLSKTDKVLVGKLNTLDLTNFSSFKGGLGVNNFQNIAFVPSPNGITTPSIFGAFYMSQNEKRDITFAVYDANNRLNQIGFKDLFADGVTFFGSFDFVTNIFGKKGHHGLMGSVSTKNVIDTQDLIGLLPGQTLEKKSNRWFLAYYFDQTLYQNPNNKKQTYGVFGQFIKNDGHGTPLDFSFVLGIGGSSLFKSRPLDKWGVAYFHYNVSNSLGGLVIPDVPLEQIIPGIPDVTGSRIAEKEAGAEVFYNAFLTPWFSIGVDFQWIAPGFSELPSGVSNSSTTYFGLRNRIIF